MAKNKRWSKAEDTILASLVSLNLENKTEAFKKASEQLKRSVSSCQNRWYTALNNPEHSAYVGTNFFGVEPLIEPMEYYVEEKLSLWQRIKRLFTRK